MKFEDMDGNIHPFSHIGAMPTSVYVVVGSIAGISIGGIGFYVLNNLFNQQFDDGVASTRRATQQQYTEVSTKSNFDIENSYQSDVTDREEEACGDDLSSVGDRSAVSLSNSVNLQKTFEKESVHSAKDSISSTKVTTATVIAKSPTKVAPPRTPVRPSNSTISSNSSGSPMRALCWEDACDSLAKDIDYFIRHKKDFSVPNYSYSVKQLTQQIKIPKELNKITLVSFLRDRPEFVLHSNKQSFSLAYLTPYRIKNVRLFGRFQCANVRCKASWCSNNSFADMFQSCVRCKTRVYPFEQAVLSSISAKDLAACEESKREAQNSVDNVEMSAIYGLEDDNRVVYYQNETRFAEV